MEKPLILVCGDTHGQWGALNQLINKKHPFMVFQTGDWAGGEAYMTSLQ